MLFMCKTYERFYNGDFVVCILSSLSDPSEVFLRSLAVVFAVK